MGGFETPDRKRLAEAIGGTDLLSEASPRDVARFAEEGTIHRYRRGTYLFHQGDPADDVFFLVSGRIEITTTSATGHRQLHTTLDGHEFFGELGPLAGGVRSATAEALEESAVWAVGSELFLEFVTAQPAVSRALLQALARQVLAHEVVVEDLLFLDLKGRVAKRLLGLVTASLDEPPPDGTMIPSIVTHADLASLAGGSRENVSRILSGFQKRGLVSRNGRRFILTDVSGLRRIAGL